MIKQGEIYWGDVGEAFPHPVVVSMEPLIRGRVIVAVLITSAEFDLRSQLKTCVPILAGHFGLSKDCVN